jgi:hypothetical protein
VDKLVSTYEAPGIDLDSREYQQNAEWHFHWSMGGIWNVVVLQAAWLCRSQGLLYQPRISWGWFKSSVRCWHRHR